MTNDSHLPTPIDVTSLGSYVFCKRAGIIAYKQQGLQLSGNEEPRIPNLSYLPEFSIEELRVRFDAELPPFLRYAAASLVGFFIVWLIARFGSISLSFLILIAMLPAVWNALTGGLTLLSIFAELARYKSASPAVLNPSATEPVSVMWYDLVKAGYKPIKPRGRFEDPELKLTGQPWRILQTTDGVRIPVMNYNGKNFKVRDSQVMRLALYSHLCKVCMPGSKSDWGILLDVESKHCFAIPINDDLRLKANLELGFFENILADFREQKKPPIPVATPCLDCRFGKPRLYVPGVSETVYFAGAIGANAVDGRGRQLVHSDCGDAFEWRPSHRYWQSRE
tara:strand:- start:11253 stop:12263 length:1011 start_codon:yes stop_codon:yes gene_type:complete